MRKSKTKKLLDEASYYTGAQTGSQSPETMSPYEFNKDAVPTLNKMASLKDSKTPTIAPQLLPHPLQDSIRELADLYLKAQNLRNKAREAGNLPLFKTKQKELERFRRQLNGIMVACKQLATSLQDFSLAPYQ